MIIPYGNFGHLSCNICCKLLEPASNMKFSIHRYGSSINSDEPKILHEQITLGKNDKIKFIISGISNEKKFIIETVFAGSIVNHIWKQTITINIIKTKDNWKPDCDISDAELISLGTGEWASLASYLTTCHNPSFDQKKREKPPKKRVIFLMLFTG